ncbi:MAG: hypothetical protein Ct9H300mP23_04570 [Nitrospinota bacterium]|nr:MAG: hypothetical protein Ct9H300mP23_04570 [Nitrospinota bacterium]
MPIELIEELQDMDNPYPATPERIELGKQIFYGKGLCVTCHSKNGKGVNSQVTLPEILLIKNGRRSEPMEK